MTAGSETFETLNGLFVPCCQGQQCILGGWLPSCGHKVALSWPNVHSAQKEVLEPASKENNQLTADQHYNHQPTDQHDNHQPAQLLTADHQHGPQQLTTDTGQHNHQPGCMDWAQHVLVPERRAGGV
jgi:hypothetical protein